MPDLGVLLLEVLLYPVYLVAQGVHDGLAVQEQEGLEPRLTVNLLNLSFKRMAGCVENDSKHLLDTTESY